MPSLKHVHTYIKYKNRPGYFRCDDPLCTHFLDKEAVRGKASRCNDCGQEFVLDSEAMRRARPKCKNCMNTKTAKTFQAARGLVDGIFTAIQNQQEELKKDE